MIYAVSNALDTTNSATMRGCVERTRALVASARAVQAAGHPHVAFHLAALALEELGRREHGEYRDRDGPSSFSVGALLLAYGPMLSPNTGRCRCRSLLARHEEVVQQELLGMETATMTRLLRALIFGKNG